MSTPPHPFAVITAETILPLIREDLGGCIAVVRDAYLAHAEGRGVNPRSVFMRFADRPDSRIIALPSHLGTSMEDLRTEVGGELSGQRCTGTPSCLGRPPAERP